MVLLAIGVKSKVEKTIQNHQEELFDNQVLRLFYY